MRNLKLVDIVHVGETAELEKCEVLCVDYDTKAVYCGTNTGLYVVEPTSREVRCGVSLTNDGYLCKDGSGVLVGIQHIPDQMAVCTATAAGDVLLWSVGSPSVECVGTVEHGLQAMSWSPDQEIIVLLTGNNTIVLMTRDFDPISEVPMHPEAFGEAEFVTVGWGKKETQFHGSEGKHAAVRKTETMKPASAWDDRKPRVSWRGDGQYFVVSSVNAHSGARVLHTWTRECSLHSTSEHVEGIEQCLAWKPSGSLVATSQRKANKYDIAFFEINGLRHGEFTLPFGVNEVTVRELLWNTESSALYVWLQQMPPDGRSGEFEPKSWVQLWTTSNYHWYLKQTLAFAATRRDRVTAVCWDPEQDLTLHIVCAGGQYLQYRWAWSTDCSHGDAPNDQSLVAVIDGDGVLVTPFRTMCVPPPMSACTLQLPASVNDVMYSTTNDALVVLCDGRIAWFTYDDVKADDTTAGSVKLTACAGAGFATQCQIPRLKGYVTLNGFDNIDSYPLQRHHFVWCDSHVIMCSACTDSDESLIHVCTMDEAELSISLTQTLEAFGRVFVMVHNPATGSVAVQMTDGSIFKLDLASCELTPWCDAGGEHITFAQPCSQMALCILGGQEVLVGLTERFRIYVNSIQLATNCTSFAIHEEFLLLTTHAHTVRCIPRHTKLHALTGLADGKAHPFDETVRRVERGSRIVCVVSNHTKVILQMPRGNLETIYPRALVLSAVRKQLDGLRFKEAFILMRKHRINMNLIYDHNPAAFVSSVPQLIRQLDSVTHINLFLTDLIEEDVTQSMYTAAYDRPSTSACDATHSASKVDVICDAVKQALQDLDRRKFLLCILTAHVRKSTPELDIALHIVQELRGCGNQGNSAAEEALKYLLFLVDVNELYDVALGTYDFQLVLMVAEKSNKDPKEYLPFLNNLRKLDSDYQKFSIDKHLKRYHSALQHITKCGKDHFEECMSLVKDQRLYAHALTIVAKDTEDYKHIARAYGDYLREKKYDEEAAIMYVKASEHACALQAFTRSGNWRQCLCMAGVLGYSAERVVELSRSLAGALRDRRQYVHAACLLDQYANDSEEAIVTLIEGHEWDEALRMMHKHARLDFMETNLRPCLAECQENELELLAEHRAALEKYTARLAIVRDENERKQCELFDQGGPRGGDSDLFSDTSSATGDSVISADSHRSGSSRKSGSIHTRVSGRSGKGRRKGERKKWSLREGSAHEDCALIEALANLIKQVNAMRDDIAELLRTLVLYGCEHSGRRVQCEYGALLSAIATHVPHIWNAQHSYSSHVPSQGFGPDSTANTIALAMQQGQHNAPSADPSIDAVLMIPPVVAKDTSWKLNVLDITAKS